MIKLNIMCRVSLGAVTHTHTHTCIHLVKSGSKEEEKSTIA